MYFSPLHGWIELSNAERAIVKLVNGFQEEIAVIAALKEFDNAEKVYETLKLWNALDKPHASYTLYPIISGIGEAEPQEYINRVEEAVQLFNEEMHIALKKYYGE
jgi:hypothetical protein